LTGAPYPACHTFKSIANLRVPNIGIAGGLAAPAVCARPSWLALRFDPRGNACLSGALRFDPRGNACLSGALFSVSLRRGVLL